MYRTVDASLSRLPVAILYIVANIAVGVHLLHRTWSLFQSLGWNRPDRADRLLDATRSVAGTTQPQDVLADHLRPVIDSSLGEPVACGCVAG